MKVIDLLNKIANGEEIPDAIKFYNDCFTWDSDYKDWINDDYSKGLLEYNFPNTLNNEIEIIEEKEETKPITKEIEALGYACGEIQKCFTNGWNKSLKNKSLIEEDKKIEKIDIYNCFHIMGDNQISRLRLDDNFQNISDKINEIIDYINKEDNK